MTYTVYFEIYGKKMKATIEARSPEQAIDIIRGKLIIHKVEPKMDDVDDLLKFFNVKR